MRATANGQSRAPRYAPEIFHCATRCCPCDPALATGPARPCRRRTGRGRRLLLRCVPWLRCPVNDHCHGNDVAACLAHTFYSGQRGAASGGSIFKHDDIAAFNAWPLNLAAHAVGLLRLADHECIDGALPGTCGVHDGGAYRVGPHGQAANIGEFQLGLVQQVKHDFANQAGCFLMQGDTAQIDVVIGFLARGQGDLAAHNG